MYIHNKLFRQLIDDVSFLSMREPRSGLHRIKSEEVHFQDDSPEDYQVNETETQVQNDKDTFWRTPDSFAYVIQGIPVFRDFTIRDPRYFVIPF